MKRVYAATYSDDQKMKMDEVIGKTAEKLGLSVSFEGVTVWFHKTVDGKNFKFAVSENTMYKLISESMKFGASKYNAYNYLKERMELELADQGLA